MKRYDVIVIGAGPAGLAAAVTASRSGRDVLLLDAAAGPGGQFWRNSDTPFSRYLGDLDYRPETPVWFVEPGFIVNGVFHGDTLVIATGAYDRVIPFPGWDLPGVVTAGGAQALLKGHGVVIGQRVVVAGTGPFLLPVASGLAHAGAEVVGVFEANNPLAYLRHPSSLRKAGEALGYGLRLMRHRVPYRTRDVVVAAHGSQKLESVTVATPRRTRQVECDVLAVGYGFTPQVELALALGCQTTLDADGSVVVTETAQAASVPAVFVAGEVTGVGGAALAVVEGELAGLSAAGLPQPRHLLRRRNALRRFASAIASVHRVPAAWPQWCADDTVICRCEGVPLGSLTQAAADLGVIDARGAKLMTRVGMGWCQGRVCGFAASHLIARSMGRAMTEADLRAFAHRPIASPITLADLADPG